MKKMSQWETNNRFCVSGNVQIEDYSLRIKTTGTIKSIIDAKHASVTLDKVENEQNVAAVVKLRDLKPIHARKDTTCE